MTSQAKLRPAASRGESKRQAILGAAQAVFLRDGFQGASMDEVARQAGVSKQTVYAHFGTKKDLFVEIVMRLSGAQPRVHEVAPEEVEPDDLEEHLADYAERELGAVLTSEIMQLRRMVIGEGARFPELAAALHEHGPQRAISTLTREIGRLVRLGLLQANDPRAAAIDFNWLVMGEPIDRAMLLGDETIPSPASIRAHAEHAAAVFLRAYGRRR
jgi:TetR/AcrR family transcriptional regulator, mexJK operon transcriptional repressor